MVALTDTSQGYAIVYVSRDCNVLTHAYVRTIAYN